MSKDTTYRSHTLLFKSLGLYARPATEFAARFIGTPPMNLFPLSHNGSGLVIAGSDGPVLAPHVDAPALGGIRPEDLYLTETGIPARVLDAEYLGADTVLACAVGEARLLARLAGRVTLQAGERVCLGSDAAIHLFDAASGARIDAVAAIKETVAA